MCLRTLVLLDDPWVFWYALKGCIRNISIWKSILEKLQQSTSVTTDVMLAMHSSLYVLKLVAAVWAPTSTTTGSATCSVLITVHLTQPATKPWVGHTHTHAGALMRDVDRS